ncbi:hypothetical protein Dimus_024565 [Dionaea muscipula]
MATMDVVSPAHRPWTPSAQHASHGRRRSKSACDRVMAASPAPPVLDSGNGGGLRLGNGGGLRLVLACDGGPRLGDGGGLRLGFGGGLRLGDYGGLCGSAMVVVAAGGAGEAAKHGSFGLQW